MATVYTNYWISKRDDIKKKHASYPTEDEALQGIKAWWELQGDQYDPKITRTNTGALEIAYVDDNYFYRVEEEKTDQPLPTTRYTLYNQGQIDAKRQAMQLDEDTRLFDELPEAYRDRIMMAMNNIKIARDYTYTKEGQPIRPLTRTAN